MGQLIEYVLRGQVPRMEYSLQENLFSSGLFQARIMFFSKNWILVCMDNQPKIQILQKNENPK